MIPVWIEFLLFIINIELLEKNQKYFQKKFFDQRPGGSLASNIITSGLKKN